MAKLIEDSLEELGSALAPLELDGLLLGHLPRLHGDLDRPRRPAGAARRQGGVRWAYLAVGAAGGTCEPREQALEIGSEEEEDEEADGRCDEHDDEERDVANRPLADVYRRRRRCVPERRKDGKTERIR